MPPARKSCQRCRDHKARCIFLPGESDCTRCKRSKKECLRPNEPSGSSAQRPSPIDPDKSEAMVFTDSAELGSLANVIDSELNFESGDKISLADIWEPYQDNPLKIFSNQKVYTYKTEAMPFVVASCDRLNCMLPGAEDGQALLSEFLHDFNSRLPIFQPETIISLYRGCYSGEHNSRPLAWVLVYATLAIAHRLRAMSFFATPTDTPQAEYYLSKSLSKLPELLMGSSSIKLVQALLMMSMLLTTSNKCHTAPLFASTAARMAEDLGYNESEAPGPNVPPSEEYYVFWLCFYLDAYMSFVDQRPTTISLANVGTLPPSETTVDWWNPQITATTSEWNVNVFAQNCSLAVIEAEASEELLSAKARHQWPETNTVTFHSIMQKLSIWRAQCALSHMAAQDVLKAMYRSDIIHCIMIEGCYFRTLYQCHATNALVQFAVKIDVFTPEALQAVFEMRDPTCYDDAKRLLNLMSLLPQGNMSTTWALLQPTVAAACTILSAHSIPGSPRVYDRVKDVELCHNVLSALESAAACGIDPGLGAAIGQGRKVYQLLTA